MLSQATPSGSAPGALKTPKAVKKEGTPTTLSSSTSSRFSSTFTENANKNGKPVASEGTKAESSSNSGNIHGANHFGSKSNNNNHYYHGGSRSPEPQTLEAVVYGVEKSLTMEQIRDDLEGSDVYLACTPRPLMRNDKNNTSPVHSIVITLLDEDSYKQCIEHSLPINYSMRRVKALRTFPRKKGMGSSSNSMGGGALGTGEWKSRRSSHHGTGRPYDSNSANTSYSYSDEEEEDGDNHSEGY